MVYLARKGDAVVCHTNLEAMRELDGIEKPDMEISNEEFETAGGFARLIDGEIFIGKTEEEKTAEENRARIILLKRKLADTDYVSAKIAEGSASKTEYAEIIAQRQAWRQEINDLSA